MIFCRNLREITFLLTNLIPELIIFVSRGITVLCLKWCDISEVHDDLSSNFDDVRSIICSIGNAPCCRTHSPTPAVLIHAKTILPAGVTAGAETKANNCNLLSALYFSTKLNTCPNVTVRSNGPKSGTRDKTDCLKTPLVTCFSTAPSSSMDIRSGCPGFKLVRSLSRSCAKLALSTEHRHSWGKNKPLCRLRDRSRRI